MTHRVGDVVRTEDGRDVKIHTVMTQDEGPAYWVTDVATDKPAVVFSEEILEA